MKTFKYLFGAALIGLSLTACSDDNDDYGMLDGIGVVTRSISLEEGTSVRAEKLTRITVDYNNIIAVNAQAPVTLNGTPVTVSVNPDDRKQLFIDVELTPYTDYTLEIPAGAVYRSDDPTVECEAVTLSFDTNTGINKSVMAQNLINTKATAEARNVYSRLLNLYGAKQLSGAMGEVGWSTAYSDFVAEQGGAYPAVVGFDYLHMPYSGPNSWINYMDISVVKGVWEAGSIPAFTWHWNVPVSRPFEATLWSGEQVMPADWSGFIQINDDAAKALLANVTAGTVITVKTKDVNAGAQGSVKNGSTWAGLTSALEYFDITGDYTVTVTADMVDAIKTDGIIISGHDYTATEVSIASAGGSDVSFNAQADQFDADNVLIPGTWENSVAEADVAKVAASLKLLQDAGIPVLWRPFHEANGDFVWGAWFWWGKKGPQTVKKLWSWLYDKLTNEYGLNNLIWVWTADYSAEGQLAGMSLLQDAYPGNDKVDIIGADIYADSPFMTRTDIFDMLHNLSGGTKMVALTECGNLLDVEQAFEDGALWAYFMCWYETPDGKPAFVNYNNASVWQSVLSNPLVLNQGEWK